MAVRRRRENSRRRRFSWFNLAASFEGPPLFIDLKRRPDWMRQAPMLRHQRTSQPDGAGKNRRRHVNLAAGAGRCGRVCGPLWWPFSNQPKRADSKKTSCTAVTA